MEQALGPVLSLAVAEAMAPVGIACAVVMLMGDRGRAKGLAYLAGWVLGIAVVGGLALAVAGSIGAGGRGSPHRWVSWLKLVGALALVVVAVVVGWAQRHHPVDGPAATPAWMRAADRAGPARAALLAAVNSSLNPANAVLVGTAALTIAHEGVAPGERVLTLVLFTALASVGVAVPVVLSLVRGEQARATLVHGRRWLIAHQAAIVIVVCLAFAAKLAGDAVTALTR